MYQTSNTKCQFKVVHESMTGNKTKNIDGFHCVERNIKELLYADDTTLLLSTPTNRFWSIDFHITVVQKTLQMSHCYPLAKTCGFCNTASKKGQRLYESQ